MYVCVCQPHAVCPSPAHSGCFLRSITYGRRVYFPFFPNRQLAHFTCENQAFCICSCRTSLFDFSLIDLINSSWLSSLPKPYVGHFYVSKHPPSPQGSCSTLSLCLIFLYIQSQIHFVSLFRYPSIKPLLRSQFKYFMKLQLSCFLASLSVLLSLPLITYTTRCVPLDLLKKL